MSVRFVLGRAGTGKSEACLREIREKLLSEPDGSPLILLVPEQATFQAEHALVSTPGLRGMIRLQVLSFRRLAWRVMQETGDTAGTPIDETGKAMMLTRILHNLRDDMRVYRDGDEQMGFVDGLQTLFAEWRRYRLTSEALKEHRERLTGSGGLGGRPLLADKLHDLALVYQEFEQELKGQYLDGEEFLDHLGAKLSEWSQLAETEIWVDGFNGFTPQEEAAVAGLMRHARRTTLTLCLDRPYAAGERPHELDLFYPTARTMVRLKERLLECDGPQSEVTVLDADPLPRFRESPPLAHLESQFEYRLSPRKKTMPHMDDRITLRSAVNRRAEVEAAVRDMVRLARERGVRWREMAVRVRHPESYGDHLAGVLTDYGIPFFFDQKRTVLHHPLVELIRSALEVALRNWRYEAVFRCVKTDFFLPFETEESEASGCAKDPRGQDGAEAALLSRLAMDELENHVLALGIQGTRWTDPRCWELRRVPQLEDEESSEPPEEKAAAKEARLRLRAARDAVVEPLLRLQRGLKAARDVRGMTEALFGLLEELRVPDRLAAWRDRCISEGRPEKAREHEQVWDSVIGVLDQLVAMVGGETLTPALFAKMIDSGLEQLRLGLVPPAPDQVLVGSVERTRSAQIRYLYVLGANDGVLPAKPDENGMLSEQEREWLLEAGVEMADGSRRKLLDEQFLLYNLLCAPSRRLWLSYAMADEEGKSLLPSELFGQLESLFPGAKAQPLFGEPHSAMDDKDVLDYLVDPGRTLSFLTVQLKQWMKGETIPALWWEAYRWFLERPAWRSGLERMVRALFYTNRETRLREETGLALYGTELVSSVSRMERFVACPFSQFASYGLRLSERPIYRLEAPDIGRLYHAALKQLVERLYGGPGGIPNAEELIRMADDIVEGLAPRLQSEILFSSSRYRYVARRLKGIVGRAAVILAEHARNGTFTPVGLELGFGPGGPLPSLTFMLPGEKRMQLAGRIDRVDRADTGRGPLVRIIDYKSSRTVLNLTELYYGLSLQMLTYLDVLLTHADRWLGTRAEPAGVLYFHVTNPMVQSSNAMDPAAVEKEVRRQLKMKGLLRADAGTVRMMDAGLEGRSGYSELVDAALTKDGGFYKSSPVATEAEWDGLRRYVRQVSWEIGKEMTGGNVDIVPYRIGAEKACTFCSYKPVCHFDPLTEGNRYQVLKPQSRQQILQGLGEIGRASDESAAAAEAGSASAAGADLSSPIVYGQPWLRTGLRIRGEEGGDEDGEEAADERGVDAGGEPADPGAGPEAGK